MAGERSVIVSAVRTPVGKLLGAFADLTAADLGGVAVRAALERAGIRGDQVDAVLLGQVLQAGAGQNPARPAAVAGGVPMTVPATTVNKVCLSGLDTVALADTMIRAGDASVVVAGGMESMTNAPHLVRGLRAGVRFGDDRLVDSMSHDGLFCSFDQEAMGAATERYNRTTTGIGRAEQDSYAATSHERAAAAQKDGRFDAELVPVEVPQRRGDPLVVTSDEGVRPGTTAESLGALRPAFGADGTITAGSASQISDGAAALVVMSRARAQELGCEVLAEVGAAGMVAGPDPSLASQPANAVHAALRRGGLHARDVDLFELNEAFAVVALQSARELGADLDRVNVDGGAIALGHPIGMSGARLVVHLVHELRRRGGGLGAAALCGGGGQGDALLVHVGG